MSKPRVWIVLSFLLVFAAGIVAGIFGHNWFAAKKPDARRSSAGGPPTMESWAKEIGLSPEQQARLREVFKANDARMRADARLKELRTDTFKRYGELRSQLQSEIDAVLTPEQKVKMDAMIKKHEEERRRANASSRRDQPPSSDSGRGGRNGGPDRAPRLGPGPDGPNIRNQRTDFRPPFHEYYSKGVNE
ncbi:MAG: hypothetical protein NTZ26_04435 [Candidatus Aminicenantes bacterium]|nr:hypothetical protein [Candidatus Aminicenantes bacterium]